MPRPSKVEEHGLDLNLIERGQYDPIKVNRKMVILDGYTRWQLLGDRGKKIKYEFRDFKTNEDELNYVVECNVMKRNITPYQKVVAMMKLFGNQRYSKENGDTYKRAYVEILNDIKKGSVTSSDLVESTGKEMTHIRSTLTKLTEQHYIHREREIDLMKHPFVYSLMPKGEEFLANAPMTKTMKEIGKDIGVDRTSVGQALRIFESDNKDLKSMLCNGSINISRAYGFLMGRVAKEKVKSHVKTKLKCPFCEHVGMRKEYKVVH
jgi:DNA-binding transcriptional ArsR family regulator